MCLPAGSVDSPTSAARPVGAVMTGYRLEGRTGPIPLQALPSLLSNPVRASALCPGLRQHICETLSASLHKYAIDLVMVGRIPSNLLLKQQSLKN